MIVYTVCTTPSKYKKGHSGSHIHRDLHTTLSAAEPSDEAERHRNHEETPSWKKKSGSWCTYIYICKMIYHV